VAVLLATLGGCLSFDQLTGGEASDAGGAIDATTTDTATVSDSAIVDASTTTLTDAFDCDAFPDAALCDDFNRTTVIPFSDPRWSNIDCYDGGTMQIVDGSLNTSAPPTSFFNCLLGSKSLPNTGNFSLDFDLVFDTLDASAPSDVIVAEVNFQLTKPNDAGLEAATYQFLISAAGDAQWQLLDYYPNPDGGRAVYASYSLAYASPFVEAKTSCHISLTANDSYMNPSGTGTSTCAGAHPITMTAAALNMSARGLSGPAILSLGYSNNDQSNAPRWNLLFDNAVYTPQ
jgi:hypothetical protein